MTAAEAPALAQLPPYLTPAQVGKACGMSRRSAKNMLRGAGILELIGVRWFVSESRLRERLPDIYDRVYEFLRSAVAARERALQSLTPGFEPTAPDHALPRRAGDSERGGWPLNSPMERSQQFRAMLPE